MDVIKRVIVHGLLKINGVQRFDPVRLVNRIPFFIPHRLSVFHFWRAALQHLPAFHKDSPFRVGNDIADARGHLHKLRLYIKPCFSAAGTADHDHVFVPGVLRLLRAAVHCKPLRLRQQYVILKNRVDKRRNVFCRPPPG